jgi:hypothetical protein
LCQPCCGLVNINPDFTLCPPSEKVAFLKPQKREKKKKKK